jgi:hypothetical protein
VLQKLPSSQINVYCLSAEISNVISTPVDSHYELGDQLGDIISASSNEATVNVRSGGLALRYTVYGYCWFYCYKSICCVVFTG